MSDIGLARSNADAVLKEFYLPGIRSQLNNEIFALTQFEMNSEDVEGRRAVISIHTGRNEGVGARAENGTLPTAGAQQYQEERIPLRFMYGRMQLSGPVIRSMASDRGAFTRAISSETEGLVRDTKNDVSRQVYGESNGKIAEVASSSTTTVTLESPSANTMRQLRKGMKIDIGSPADPTSRGTFTIVSVDRAAGTFVTDSASSAADGEAIFRHGSGGEGANQLELTGLQTQVSATGALFNVDPAVADVWASYELTSAGAASEDMFIQASQEVNVESGEQLDLWLTNQQVHRDVANLLTSLKRFPGTLELKGGYKALDMSDVSQGNTGSNECGMFWEKDMVEDGVAYGLTLSSWNVYNMSDWEFMQEDGAVLNRVPNTDAYEATLFRYMELATHKRNANCKISGIT